MQTMKRIILLFILSVFTRNMQAQTYMPSGKDRYKEISGRYGGNDGLCLFDDGTFMLYGYATAVFGSYVFEKDYLSFYPDTLPLFEVYAGKNNSIGDSTRLNFAGFERGGATFVSFGNAGPQPVFNDDANCFDEPFVYRMPGQQASLTLYYIPDQEDEQQKASQARLYNCAGYNDFILVYNKLHRERENFRCVFFRKPGEPLRIRLSSYGGDEGYRKQEQDEEEQKQWAELLAMKDAYYGTKARAEQGIFANKHYNLFWPDTAAYRFDKTINQYISRLAAENEDYFKDNPYKDDRYLLRYNSLPAVISTGIALPGDIKTTPVFFTVCGDGAEKSYHYDGYEKQEPDNTGDEPRPVTIQPAAPVK